MAIYFDMDGVMADFAAGVNALGAACDSPETGGSEKDDAMWAAIKARPHFYRDLDEIPSGTALFRNLMAAGLAPEVLTAIPKPKRNIQGAAEDKIQWNLEHLGPDVKTHICQRAEKIQWCHGPEDILIDDQARNIQEWQSAGGTGILFQPGQPVKLPPRIDMAMKAAGINSTAATKQPRPES